MTYHIIATGSTGNAVLLNDHILIDCGVPYSKVKPYEKDLRLVLLTHVHSDHFKPRTVAALHRARPTLRFACCDWMVKPLMDAGVDPGVIDLVSLGTEYVYYTFQALGQFSFTIPSKQKIRAEETVHDVRNCCWYIDIDGERAFYATDTGNLDRISAPNYDLYLIESNYAEAELAERIAAKEAAGEYCYEYRAEKTHLSQEQALEWLHQNMGPNSQYKFLHEHKE